MPGAAGIIRGQRQMSSPCGIWGGNAIIVVTLPWSRTPRFSHVRLRQVKELPSRHTNSHVVYCSLYSCSAFHFSTTLGRTFVALSALIAIRRGKQKSAVQPSERSFRCTNGYYP